MTNEQLVSFPIKFVQVLVFSLVMAACASGIWRVWQEELRAKELYSYVAVTATEYAAIPIASGALFELEYTYEYEGVSYTGNTLSPFPEANQAARLDEDFRKWITRSDTVDLVVYVNPDNPAEASVLRGWVGVERLRVMTAAGFIASICCMALYLVLSPVRRVAHLFKL
jgi:hypothetical protein